MRANADSTNNLEEKPAIFSMIGNMEHKSILDLGCGYGENCKMFSDNLALFIVGIDISEKMLNVAKSENNAKNIKYFNMCMEDISSLNNKFDIVVSSLALHYVKDFNKLVKDIFSLMNDGGIFVFSQEHPLTTAPINGANWIKNENGIVDHYRLTDYSKSGDRKVSWFVDGVIKYHRTFSDIINGLILAGFIIDTVDEPIPTKDMIKKSPNYENNLHKPNFLIIKARKQA